MPFYERRGRKPTGHDPVITARIPEEMLEALDAYASAEKLNRSEAVKRLIGEGLPRHLYNPEDD